MGVFVILLATISVFALFKVVLHAISLSKSPRSGVISGLSLLLAQRKNFYRHSFSEGSLRAHRQHGRTYMSHFPGGNDLYTIEPANIRTVTTAKFQEYGKSFWAEQAKYCIGSGVLINDGSAWTQSRQALKPVFWLLDPARLSPVLKRHTEALYGCISRHDAQAFAFKNVAQRYMLDVVSELFWGQSPSSLSEELNVEAEEFLSHIHLFERVSSGIINLGIAALPQFLLDGLSTWISVIRMKRYFKNQIEDDLSTNSATDKETRQTVVQCIAKSPISKEALQGEVRNLFFASFDTTSALLANLIDIISRREDVQTQIRHEIRASCSEDVTREQIASCQYLRWTILETIRLYSPVTYHSRQARQDTYLPIGPDGKGPYHIAKGTTVIWSTYALNRDSKIYGQDSETFRPERWAHTKPGENFMPFGSGPRQCPGQQIALHIISYTVIRILQEFDHIACEDEEKFKEAIAVSFSNANETMVSMRYGVD